jgi:NADPH:quinone reductase-like Zn-dependent oxidoreductase
VNHFRRHDAVYVYSYPLYDNGAWADYMLVPEAYVARAPVSLTLANAGALPVVGLTAYDVIHEILVPKRGETILITAASGGVGHLAVQMARHVGARVIGVCGTDHVGFVKSLGADEVIDYTKEDPVKALRARHPNGITKAINAVPGNAANVYVDAMATGGVIVDLPGEITASRPGVKVVGGYVVQGDGGRLGKLAQMLDHFLRATISETYPFESARTALDTVLAKHVTGKVALHVVDPHGGREAGS